MEWGTCDSAAVVAGRVEAGVEGVHRLPHVGPAALEGLEAAGQRLARVGRTVSHQLLTILQDGRQLLLPTQDLVMDGLKQGGGGKGRGRGGQLTSQQTAPPPGPAPRHGRSETGRWRKGEREGRTPHITADSSSSRPSTSSWTVCNREVEGREEGEDSSHHSRQLLLPAQHLVMDGLKQRGGGKGRGRGEGRTPHITADSSSSRPSTSSWTACNREVEGREEGGEDNSHHSRLPPVFPGCNHFHQKLK